MKLWKSRALPEIFSFIIFMVAPARRIAFEVLQKVIHEKANSSILIDYFFSQQTLSEKDRHLSTQLVYGTLRWQKKLDYIISLYSHVPLTKIDMFLLILLRLALYQILFLDRVPPSAAVYESVELSKEIGHPGHAAFSNALLRKVCRQKGNIKFPSAKKSQKDYLAFTLSHPSWLVERCLERWGYSITEKMFKANNREAPVYVRINTLKIGKEVLREKLIGEGVEVNDCSLLPHCFRLNKLRLQESESFKRGYFYVLDAASQLIAILLAPEENQVILDTCAAPGGKTACLAFSINQKGKIIANDLHWGRIKQLQNNLNRLDISCTTIVQSDIVKPLPYMPVFDRVLIDAPCSALGRIRRSPEIKWNRDPEDIIKLAQRQLIMIEKVSEVLKPGGLLVYSVCSLEKEENEEVIYKFLQRNKSYHQIPCSQYLGPQLSEFVDSNGFLRTFPHKHNMDGFFAALLTRD